MDNKIDNICNMLDKAIKFEDEAVKSIPHEERPLFHFSSPIGWINDPNGFSEFNGEYNLFYQYYPYETKWGPMHWGHSKSHDLIKWERLPIVMAPDQDYDFGGCFSGSAVEYNGKHVLMYTGVREIILEDGSHFVTQDQCIAVGDGINYKKLDCNPVIKSEDLPEGCSIEDFRDPYIWNDNGIFYAVVGNRHADGSGQILLFKSEDLSSWSFVSVLDRSRNQIGRMWECPNFVNIDGSDVMIISPQEVKRDSKLAYDGNNTVYLIGRYDKETHEFIRDDYAVIDSGLDFYAPQVLKAKDGRTIMIGWMQSWDNNIVPQDFKWSGMMSIPRELSIKDNKLIQKPVSELNKYHSDHVEYKNLVVNNEVKLDGISGRTLDLSIDIDAADCQKFMIKIAKNDDYETVISYDAERKYICFDRSNSGCTLDVVHTRKMKINDYNKKVKLRLIIDRYSVEIFANDGEHVMTNTLYTPFAASDITFSADGDAKVSIEKYNIEVR